MNNAWAPTVNYDKRFYGIYEGSCTNNADPEGKYKIKLHIPQVLGQNETDWAFPCLPVTDNADHLDHLDHTASQVASLLTTTSVTVGSGLGSVTVPPLTVVPISNGSLSHPHVLSTNNLDTSPSNPQHSAHRKVPNVGQKVWVMFIAGDPNFPVWLGVEL
jgi:Type VI secretion system/phage-baseplate injector OB domain